jgi:hypothetical protein
MILIFNRPEPRIARVHTARLIKTSRANGLEGGRKAGTQVAAAMGLGSAAPSPSRRPGEAHR